MQLLVIVLKNILQRQTKDRTNNTRHYCFSSSLFQSTYVKTETGKTSIKN